jgi:hypothetical protein
MVIAANGSGTTIKDRVLDPTFVNDATAAPAQTIAAGCGKTCELWAKAGTINVPGLGSVPIWGYATSAGGLPTLPGPTIIVNAGDSVTITVHNGLASDLGFEARSVPTADRTAQFASAAAGADGTYKFTAKQVGTSVYGASAKSPMGNRQFAMGLSGVLIVRPAECALGVPQVYLGCTYGNPSNPANRGSQGWDVGTDTFNGEALVAMNEIDPLFAANPLTYDITNYHPTAHLINGRVFPETEVIDAFVGDKVLIRYANLGLADHSMGLVGTHQRVIGRDATALPHGSDDVTVPLNVGQTADVMVRIPLDARGGFRYALADQVRQPGAKSANGALTFLTVWGQKADASRPTSELSITPPLDDTSGAIPLAFTGTIPVVTPAVDHYRVSIDDPGVNAASILLTTPSISDAVSVAALAPLVNGGHILWVELSTDGGFTWGDPSGVAFTLDRAGPAVQPVTADPVYVNGDLDVAISATADSTLTGTGTVVQGTANIDGCPGTGQPTGIVLDSNGPAPIVDLTGVIPAATVGALSEGEHTIKVAAKDNRGKWSNTGDGVTPLCGSATIVVDLQAPEVSGGTVTPNDNDGTMAFPTVDTYLDVVRITATIDDPGAKPAGIAEVEGFLDDGVLQTPLTIADYGTGFQFTPVDGTLDSAHELVYADIPLAAIGGLALGDHKIWIHGRDLAGNWGDLTDNPAASATLTVINGAPRVTELFYDATTQEVLISGASNGVGATIVGFEYNVGPAPLAPNAAGATYVAATAPLGTTASVVLTSINLSNNDNLWVRVKDSTGKYSPVVSGLSVVSGLARSNNRRQATFVVLPALGAIVDGVEWSVGPNPAAAGSGNAVDFTILNSGRYLIERSNGQAFGASGTKLWVRVTNTFGNWSPAVSVTL